MKEGLRVTETARVAGAGVMEGGKNGTVGRDNNRSDLPRSIHIRTLLNQQLYYTSFGPDDAVCKGTAPN